MNIKRHIFNFIADHHVRLNHLPTQSEVRRAFGNLTEDVDLHLEQLQREGLLELSKTGDDSIAVPRTFPPVRRIELRGASFSKMVGTEDPTVQSCVALDLRGAGLALEGDLFAQVVYDSSMTDAGIMQGDVAILKAAQPERGEIVAVEESGRLVLRRYVIIAGIPHFLAENPSRPDLTVAYDKAIHGVLWCLICTKPNGRGRCSPPIKKVTYLKDRGAALETEFVKILRSALKEGPTVGSGQADRASIAKSSEKGLKKKAMAQRNPVECDPVWPKPPSGIALNDKGNPNYRVAPQRMVCDERPDESFGGAFVEAPAQFALKSKLAGEPLDFDSSTPAAAKSPCRPRESSARGARRTLSP